MEKGHYGQYTGNARHSKVTNSNMGATKRDDEAHMEYLKEDIDYDNKHGHSDSSMTADEKHISRLAGDLKYDEKKHGSPTRMEGGKDQHQNIMNDKVTGPGGKPGGNSDADRWRKHQTSKHHSSPAKMMDDAAVKAPTNNLDKAKMTKAMAKGTKEAVAEKLAKKKKK